MKGITNVDRIVDDRGPVNYNLFKLAIGGQDADDGFLWSWSIRQPFNLQAHSVYPYK